MKKEIYIIVAAHISHIEELVNSKIKDGYLPVGGILYVDANKIDKFVQAMMLKEYIK